jgi:hypothetical protein
LMVVRAATIWCSPTCTAGRCITPTGGRGCSGPLWKSAAGPTRHFLPLRRTICGTRQRVWPSAPGPT